MIVAALQEPAPETRVAITPTAVKQYLKQGYDVLCESNAGVLAGFSDEAYRDAGAKISKDRKSILKTAQILVCLNEPTPKSLKGLSTNTLLITPIDSDSPTDLLTWCCKNKVTLFSMSNIPRIGRAQSLDSLSSQANLAGYRAVIEAVSHFQRVVPMMMTAAGMIQPAKVLVLGAGVAGLQAIATAKRLGAVVYAFDVRQAAKEQVESLNAEFIAVEAMEDLETSSGYAKEVSADQQQQQHALIANYARQVDMIITTALIPGKKAPCLLPKETVLQMKPGSVIVDLATSHGGNCEGSKLDQVVHHHGITIIGYSNMARLIPATASELYTNNVVNLLNLLVKGAPPSFHFNKDDTILQQAILSHEGEIRPFQLIEEK